jgi:hypothetical protein
MPVNKCEGCEYLEESEELKLINELFEKCRISKNEDDGEYYVEHPDKDIAVKLSELVKWHWEDFDADDDDDDPKDNQEDEDEPYYGLPY